MAANKKTKKMIKAEHKLQGPLEVILPDMVTEKGISDTADFIGVSKATLGYWLLKLGIVTRRICLGAGDSMTVRRHHAQTSKTFRVSGATSISEVSSTLGVEDSKDVSE